MNPEPNDVWEFYSPLPNMKCIFIDDVVDGVASCIDTRTGDESAISVSAIKKECFILSRNGIPVT